jgi:hypothetical protein
VSTFQRLERFATRLAQDGAEAYEQSGRGAKVAGRFGAVVTAPIGAVTGGAIGSLDRVVSSFAPKSTGELITHGKPGDADYRQTIIWEPSNLVKTARFFAVPAGVGAAAAGVYNAYALLVSGGGLWSLTGAALIGFVAAGIAWAAKSVASGAWAGGKLGFKGGVGAASIGTRKTELFFKGEIQLAPRQAERARP